MGLGGAPEIDDTSAEERDEISRATGRLRLLAEGDIAVVGRIALRPPHEPFDFDGEHYSARYEWSRTSSPFNASVYATTNRTDHVIQLSAGRKVVLDAGGVRDEGLLDGDARRQALIEEFGYSEEIVDLLPVDEPPSR